MQKQEHELLSQIFPEGKEEFFSQESKDTDASQNYKSLELKKTKMGPTPTSARSGVSWRSLLPQ
jgi:hypothetical protein